MGLAAAIGIISGAIGLCLLVGGVIAARRGVGVYCRFCDYDLRHAEQRCTECGAALPRSAVRYRRRPRKMVAGGAGLLLASMIVLHVWPYPERAYRWLRGNDWRWAVSTKTLIERVCTDRAVAADVRELRIRWVADGLRASDVERLSQSLFALSVARQDARGSGVLTLATNSKFVTFHRTETLRDTGIIELGGVITWIDDVAHGNDFRIAIRCASPVVGANAALSMVWFGKKVVAGPSGPWVAHFPIRGGEPSREQLDDLLFDSSISNAALLAVEGMDECDEFSLDVRLSDPRDRPWEH